MAKKKEKKPYTYYDYIVDHIANVNEVWKRIRNIILSDEEIKTNLGLGASHIYKIDRQIADHDKSKFSPEEYEGYRQWFSPEKWETRSEDFYLKSLIHHYHNNPHHWNHWVTIVNGKPIGVEMPLEFIMEMVCDLGGMSLGFGGTSYDFYNKKRNEFILSEKTREVLEKYLKFVDEFALKEK